MAPSVSAPVHFPLYAGKPPVEFRYSVSTALQFEERAGCSPWMLSARGQSVKALVLLVQYGLLHADPAMTELKAKKAIERFIDHGGKVTDLSEAVRNALNASGVYGETETTADDDGDDGEDDDQDADGEGSANPPTTKTESGD